MESYSDSDDAYLQDEYDEADLKAVEKKNLFDDDDSDSSDDQFAELERRAEAIDEERRQVEMDAALEHDQQVLQQYQFILPTDKELEQERHLGVTLDVIKARIEEVVRVLANFKMLRYAKTPRKAYFRMLKMDLSYYYGYVPDLIDTILDIFPPVEAIEYLEANEQPRPITIRTNTLKSKRDDIAVQLINRGVNLDPVPWSEEGLIIYESPIPIGATPEYLAGHYMIQSASSWCPVMALNPKPGEKILDMAAAPGGKTTHIAAMMKNTGLLMANDVNINRTKSLAANIHRMGIRNTIITNYDGSRVNKSMRGFDRVLLDAPCTGLGIVAKDQSIKVKRDKGDISRMAQDQKRLLLSAIDAVNANSATGGIIVYSTCSVAIEENEWVVNYALANRNVKLIDIEGLDIGSPGIKKFKEKRFHPSITKTRRFYPHTLNMDGFYVAKFRKFSNKIPNEKKRKRHDSEELVEGEPPLKRAKENNVAPAESKNETADEDTPVVTNRSKTDARKRKRKRKRERLLARRRGEVEGGAVAFEGEDEENKLKHKPDA